jgi:hypothetical protein
LGKSEDKPEGEGLAFHVVKKLLVPFERRGHNVTGNKCIFKIFQMMNYIESKNLLSHWGQFLHFHETHQIPDRKAVQLSGNCPPQ